MNEDVRINEGARTASMGLIAGLVVAVLLGIGALIWCYGLNKHLSAAESQLTASERRNEDLAQKQEALSAKLQATSETFGQSLGMTQKQIDVKTQQLMALQASEKSALRSQTVETRKLSKQQAEAEKQLGVVATDVTAVKTDVGGAKQSIADTQTDLATTKETLQRTIGDAGVMSGLIARNHDELEVLKHKGDKTYYEFTLQKGAQPTLLSTVKLQAKKIDNKHAKYTMIVSADDRNIEKKDKSLDEPVQFYTGKDPALYEVVVNNISKNQISGYLAIPKGGTKSM